MLTMGARRLFLAGEMRQMRGYRLSLLVCTGMALAASAGSLTWARAAGAQPRRAPTLSFYTSFGRTPATPTYEGGPYIIGAVGDPAGDGGDGEIRVIFNEAIDAASVTDPSAGAGGENYDFRAHGFGWAGTGNFGAAMPTEVEVLDIPSAGEWDHYDRRGRDKSEGDGNQGGR